MVPQFKDLAPGIRLVEQLRLLGKKVTRAANDRMAKDGVSYTRARLLACLARDGPMRSTDLAQHFNQAPRTITEAIDGLEREGFVTREADPGDRRAKRIVISESGRIALRHSYGAATIFGEELSAMLGPADLARLQAQLERIERHLGGSGDLLKEEAA